jgi:hypothetical protein
MTVRGALIIVCVLILFIGLLSMWPQRKAEAGSKA